MKRRRLPAGTHALAFFAAAGWGIAVPSAAEPVRDAGLRSEPAIERLVAEDDRARIEELRVRGVMQRVVVRPKGEGVVAYEIVMPAGGRDLSTGPGANRGAGGQRVWSVMNF
jgi:hypothetical protein